MSHRKEVWLSSILLAVPGFALAANLGCASDAVVESFHLPAGCSLLETSGGLAICYAPKVSPRYILADAFGLGSEEKAALEEALAGLLGGDWSDGATGPDAWSHARLTTLLEPADRKQLLVRVLWRLRDNPLFPDHFEPMSMLEEEELAPEGRDLLRSYYSELAISCQGDEGRWHLSVLAELVVKRWEDGLPVLEAIGKCDPGALPPKMLGVAAIGLAQLSKRSQAEALLASIQVDRRCGPNCIGGPDAESLSILKSIVHEAPLPEDEIRSQLLQVRLFGGLIF